jgi:hypothetical protein
MAWVLCRISLSPWAYNDLDFSNSDLFCKLDSLSAVGR